MIGGALLDLLYPRACAQCGGAADLGHFFCWDCLGGLLYIQPPFCSHCGDPVPGHIDHAYICVYCSRSRPFFDQARSAIRYEGVGGLALRALKYDGATWLVPDITDWLEACWRTEYNALSFDGLCYVPLHTVHERERGFNQAALLAEGLAVRLGLPVWHDALVRRVYTSTQTRLTASQRAINVRGVFTVGDTERVKGQRLLLVDDVMTTGATVNECARTLRKAGVHSVHVLTVARG